MKQLLTIIVWNAQMVITCYNKKINKDINVRQMTQALINSMIVFITKNTMKLKIINAENAKKKVNFWL